MNVIVTGGSRGIGKCLVENLARDGYNVLLNYNKSEKQARKIQEDLRKDGIIIEIFKADVSKKEQVKAMVEFALKNGEALMYLLIMQVLQNCKCSKTLKRKIGTR